MSLLIIRFSESRMLIHGDFNINLLKYNQNLISLQFVSLMYECNFRPVILRPTRVTSQSATLIDHIWVNCVEKVTKNGIIMTTMSDHYSAFVCVNGSSNKDDAVYKETTKRQMTDGALNDLQGLVGQYNWDSIKMHADVDQCYNAFIDKISLLFDQACPNRNIKVTWLDLAKPYITAEIKNQIKEKHKLQRLYNKYPLTYNKYPLKLGICLTIP